jgi:hypothetical protein
MECASLALPRPLYQGCIKRTVLRNDDGLIG